MADKKKPQSPLVKAIKSERLKTVAAAPKPKLYPKNVAEQYMRDQMIGVFDTPPMELINTTEYKKIQRREKEKQEAKDVVEKRKAKVKAAKAKETKVETVKQYMQYMNQQSALRKDHPANSQEAWAHELRSQSVMSELRTGLARESIRSRQNTSKMSRLTASSIAPSEGLQHERLLSLEMAGEAAEEDTDYEILPKGRIPSWTYFDQFGEDDDGIHVAVGTDSKDRAKTLKTPPKMYNVSLGVKPKDIAKVYQTPPWDPWRPKMYDVSVGVGPTDQTMRDSQAKMKQMLLEKEEAYGEALPEDELTEAEVEFRRMERIKLQRKPSKRFDAATLARPAGYRDLDVSIPFEGLAFENSTQVNEFEIERTMAAKRGIFLTEGNILWPTNRDFSQELGKRNVEDYVRRGWKLDKEWMFHVRFLQSHNTNYRRKFIYEAVFSCPTITAPVPAATASVFFVFEIGHYAALDEPIKVHYCFEATRFCHTPGHLPFNIKWLSGIILDKTRMQRSIDF